MSPRTPFASASRHRRSLVAIACLLAQAFALVHLFAMHHVRCAEHGDLLHVEERGASAHEPLTEQQHAALGASEQNAGHQGDHCTTLTERRDLRTWCSEPMAVLPPSELTSLPFAQAPTLVARPLYRLAPKISPPHVG